MRMKVESLEVANSWSFKGFVTGEIWILCKIFAVLCGFGPHPDSGELGSTESNRIVNITHKESISFVGIGEMAFARDDGFQSNKSNRTINDNKQFLFCLPLHFARHEMRNWDLYALTSVPFGGLNTIPEIYWWLLHWGAPLQWAAPRPEDLPIKKSPGRAQWVGWSAWYLPCAMFAVGGELVGTSLENCYWVRLYEVLSFCFFIQIPKGLSRDPCIEQMMLLHHSVQVGR